MSEHICPKCKSVVQNPLTREKKRFPRWKTLVKGKVYQCRLCGHIKEIKNEE